MQKKSVAKITDSVLFVSAFAVVTNAVSNLIEVKTPAKKWMFLGLYAVLILISIWARSEPENGVKWLGAAVRKHTSMWLFVLIISIYNVFDRTPDTTLKCSGILIVIAIFSYSNEFLRRKRKELFNSPLERIEIKDVLTPYQQALQNPPSDKDEIVTVLPQKENS